MSEPTKSDLQLVIKYINSQQGAPFTGASGLAGFQLQISEAILRSEIGSSGAAYRISHAVVGRSGFSFGAAQWDVGNFGAMHPQESRTNFLISMWTRSLTGLLDDKVSMDQQAAA